MTGLLKFWSHYLVVAFVLMGLTNACRPDPHSVFLEKMHHLAVVKDDAKAVEGIADLVRYASEHDLKYRCELYRVRSDELVPSGDLGRHLDDDLEVKIILDTPYGFSAVRWNPPSNGYLAQLVGPAGKSAP